MSRFVVVAGMSGAGRSTAAAALEDLGWFVIDNLPSALISEVVDLVIRPGSELDRVALVIGRGGSEAYTGTLRALDNLRREDHVVQVLFLTADDDVLVRRFEGTRRRHPMAGSGVEQSVAEERQLLQVIRERADIVLDTGELNVNQLRRRVLEMFGDEQDANRLQVSVLSFGYKHGLPLDVDLLFDCRFLANPHWIEELRPLTGLDQPVRDYVLAFPAARDFLRRVQDLLIPLLPAYEQEGKSYLTVAMGCTGGRHRSVVLAEELRSALVAKGTPAAVFHRDIDR